MQNRRKPLLERLTFPGVDDPGGRGAADCARVRPDCGFSRERLSSGPRYGAQLGLCGCSHRLSRANGLFSMHSQGFVRRRGLHPGLFSCLLPGGKCICAKRCNNCAGQRIRRGPIKDCPPMSLRSLVPSPFFNAIMELNQRRLHGSRANRMNLPNSITMSRINSDIYRINNLQI
jgi:hypothetical protein